jgi:hypothetical protein
MVTIQNLEVRFDVEGEGDEAAFVRLFAKYMKLWQRQEAEQATSRRRAERDRSLGGPRPAEGG